MNLTAFGNQVLLFAATLALLWAVNRLLKRKD